MKIGKKILYTLVLYTLPFTCMGQFADDFTDGNFTSNPEWTGDNEDFIVNDDKMLQLHSQHDGANLFTRSALSNNVEWSFRIQVKFSPSDKNHVIVWLMVDTIHDGNISNGVYMKIGENGSNDAPQVFLRNNNVDSLILRGLDNTVSAQFDKDFKIMLYEDDKWMLYSKNHSTPTYTFEGNSTFHSNINSSWFGIHCTFTSSNAEKFFFDNFVVRQLNSDEFAPKVNLMAQKNDSTLTIAFNTYVVNIDDVSNYRFDDTSLILKDAIVADDNNSVANIIVDGTLANNQYINLCLSGFYGHFDKTMKDTCIAITTHVSGYGDIVIDEIMFDVNPPPQELPPCDFLELYNNTSTNLDISDLKIILKDTFYIPKNTLFAENTFMVVTSKNFDMEIPSAAIVYPSLNITSDDRIILSDTNDETIFFVNNTEIIENIGDSDGGKSLEMIDLSQPCISRDNWAWSTSSDGGTPGKTNSVDEKLPPDVILPYIEDIMTRDNNAVEVTLSEVVDGNLLFDIDNYVIEPQLTINSVHGAEGSPTNIIIDFNENIDTGLVYALTIDNITDCAGNNATSTMEFCIGKPPDIGEIVINEILFNGFGISDYVEIHNKAETALDISALSIGYANDMNSANGIKYFKTPATHTFIKPLDYLVFTGNDDRFETHYPCKNMDNIVVMQNFADLNSASGYLSLRYGENKILDKLSYSDDMHISFLTNTKDVSLERISYYNSSNYKENWHTAASDCNFGSPGIKNSQNVVPDAHDEEYTLSLTPRIVTPDNDGIDDILSISYNIPHINDITNFYVYNAGGILTKHLVNNEILGSVGTLAWDCEDEKGNVVKPGVYIILMEIIVDNKVVKKRKMSFVVK